MTFGKNPLSVPLPRVTQTELARLTGLSQKTVNLALRGAEGVSAATIANVRRLAEQHGYRLNASASAMRGRQTRLIGAVVCNLPHSPPTHLVAYETILGVDSFLADNGYLTCLVRLTDLPGQGRASRVFNEVLLDGVIVIDQLPEAYREPVAQVTRHCVWADAGVWRPTHCIRRDERAAGDLAATRLAERDVRQLLWVGHSPSIDVALVKQHYSYALRRQGARRAAVRHGLALSELPDFGTDAAAFLEHLTHTVRAAPTGVIAYNSNTALAVSEALARRHLIAGESYALASCDSTRHDDQNWPELARVMFDRQELGYAAARMMLASLEGRTADCASSVVCGGWHEGATAAGMREDRRVDKGPHNASASAEPGSAVKQPSAIGNGARTSG